MIGRGRRVEDPALPRPRGSEKSETEGSKLQCLTACAVSILLGLAIAEGRLSTLSAIAAIAVISSIAVPVMFTGFGRRAIAVPVPPLL